MCLVELLVCPDCKSGLTLFVLEENNGRVKEGMLKCAGCSGEYEIKNYIPRFVTEEIYSSSFGKEWHFYKKVKGPEMAKDEMKRMLAVEKRDVENKIVLDVGCGAGSYINVCADRYGARYVVGVDLSRSVDAAIENVGHLSNIMIIQADLFHLPFKDGYFDVVYSSGVLHHTPDTKGAFDAITKYVKPGGLLAVWLYGNYWARKSGNQDRIRKYITSKLSHRGLHALSNAASYLYFFYKVPFVGTALREMIPLAMDSVREVRALNNFDLYSPAYINRHYLDEVYCWFKENGFREMEPSGFILGMKGYKKDE